jgi:hypothetical protein
MVEGKVTVLSCWAVLAILYFSTKLVSAFGFHPNRHNFVTFHRCSVIMILTQWLVIVETLNSVCKIIVRDQSHFIVKLHWNINANSQWKIPFIMAQPFHYEIIVILLWQIHYEHTIHFHCEISRVMLWIFRAVKKSY